MKPGVVAFVTFAFLIVHESSVAIKNRNPTGNAKANEAGSRSLGFGFKAKKTTPKPIYKWRPKVESRAVLAQQKGVELHEIQDSDAEFQFVWSDDYYDNYDFEHTRNMIQHGTWEARRQNYHSAQLREAQEAVKKSKKGD